MTSATSDRPNGSVPPVSVRRSRAGAGRHCYRVQATVAASADVVLRATDGEVVVRWSSRHAPHGSVDRLWIDERDDLTAELVQIG